MYIHTYKHICISMYVYVYTHTYREREREIEREIVVDLLDLWVEREIISGSRASRKTVSGSRDNFWLNLVLNEKNGFISRFHMYARRFS